MRLASILFVLLAAACSSSSSGSGDGGSGSGGGAGTSAAGVCHDGEQTIELSAFPSPSSGSTGYPTVRGVLDIKGELSLLVQTAASDGSALLSFVRAGADGTPDVVPLSSDVVLSKAGYTLHVTPVAVGDKRCVVFIGVNGTLQFACDDGTSEDSAIDDVSNDHAPLLPVVDKSGTLHVFAQTFSAYTEIVRTTTGKWSEKEKYESSISYPTDAVAFSSGFVTCFINEAGYAAIDSGGSDSTSTKVKASTCRVASDGKTIHVLAGSTYLGLPAPAAQTVDALSDSSSSLGPMFVRQGKPYVIVSKSTTIEALPLQGGDSIALGAAGAAAYQVSDDAVHLVSTTNDTTAANQKTVIRLTTRCL